MANDPFPMPLGVLALLVRGPERNGVVRTHNLAVSTLDWRLARNVVLEKVARALDAAAADVEQGHRLDLYAEGPVEGSV